MSTLALLAAALWRVWCAGGPALEKLVIVGAALLLARLFSRAFAGVAI